MKKSSVFVIALIFIGIGCNDYTPKPKSYPRVIYPEKEYKLTDTDCPFEMEIPKYSSLVMANSNDDCWFNLIYHPFNATLHISYKRIYNQSSLDSLMEDSYKLAFKHISKAEEIIEKEFLDSNGNYGMIYDLEGKTATPLNFYITDRKEHFFRGSFYFNIKTNRDSVAPIYNFIQEDIQHSMNTFRWK